MKLEIVEKKENPPLRRTEVKFRVSHPGASTPKRTDVRNQLASALQSKPELVVIEKMASLHGKSETSGIARVYQTEEEMRALEPQYLFRRGVAKERPEEEKPAEKPKEGSGG